MKAALVMMLAAPSPVPTVQLAPSAMSGAPLTPSLALMPSLTALSVLPAPSVGDAFDGAHAERRAVKAEAVQYARAEIPAVDYRRGAYDKENTREFMESVGRELLALLVTEEALDPDLVPDPDRVDFNRLGRTSAQIRTLTEEKDIPYHPYERMLKDAFRDGLIYRLYNKNTSLTYYGVPPRVRADWGLQPAPEALREMKVPVPLTTPFSEALSALARQAVSIDDDELFEFTAQTVAAAVKEGRMAKDAVPEAFRKRAALLDFDVPTLRDAALTLSESAEGTPWEARTAALLALLD